MADYLKQLTFFSNSQKKNNDLVESSSEDQSIFDVYIDGASRNNPGPAGAGICIKKNNTIIFEQGFFIGNRTNNQAEYFGLLIAIYIVKEYVQKNELILIHSDSQLLIRQMLGVYKVKDLNLKKMQQVAYEMLRGYLVKFSHVYREHNTRADMMANRGIDKQIPLPKKFVDIMRLYGID